MSWTIDSSDRPMQFVKLLEPSDRVHCPAGFQVSELSCIDRHVDAAAFRRRGVACCTCELGRRRRADFAGVEECEQDRDGPVNYRKIHTPSTWANIMGLRLTEALMEKRPDVTPVVVRTWARFGWPEDSELRAIVAGVLKVEPDQIRWKGAH